MFGLHDEPFEVTMSRLHREVEAGVAIKHAAAQLGEDFAGLDDRRAPPPRAQPDRRESVLALGRDDFAILDEDLDEDDSGALDLHPTLHGIDDAD